MKKNVILSLNLIIFCLAGCVSIKKHANPLVNNTSTFAMENAVLLNRPAEYVMEIGEKVIKETATHSSLLGITTKGRNVTLSAPVVTSPFAGKGKIIDSGSSAQAEACVKILEKNPQASGLLVTQVVTEKRGFPPLIPFIYSSETAYVKARLITLEFGKNAFDGKKERHWILTREEAQSIRSGSVKSGTGIYNSEKHNADAINESVRAPALGNLKKAIKTGISTITREK